MVTTACACACGYNRLNLNPYGKLLLNPYYFNMIMLSFYGHGLTMLSLWYSIPGDGSL